MNNIIAEIFKDEIAKTAEKATAESEKKVIGKYPQFAGNNKMTRTTSYECSQSSGK